MPSPTVILNTTGLLIPEDLPNYFNSAQDSTIIIFWSHREGKVNSQTGLLSTAVRFPPLKRKQWIYEGILLHITHSCRVYSGTKLVCRRVISISKSISLAFQFHRHPPKYPIYISLPIVYNQQITLKNSKVKEPSNQDFASLEMNGYLCDEPPALISVFVNDDFLQIYSQSDLLSMSNCLWRQYLT